MTKPAESKSNTKSQKDKSGINYWEVALEAAVAATPIIGPSAVALLRASQESKKASESNDLATLTDEAERQRVELLMAEMQARVAQEMAIAQRIQSAQEVEIEEYYEGTGEGNAGLKASDGALNIGISGKGSKVTKRVYRFKGQQESIVVEPK
ncbi:hypothetical protein [Shewanella algae]|uniref:hypothetical protein n=1 Tax=Shewanella algae TaxID=38313 RepID=UPI001AADDE62|nr:hypothetical protein [Shewanella algae]MBO2616523.1 hypothetical protein [Shewanella algae]